jgi:hypothetical protein
VERNVNVSLGPDGPARPEEEIDPALVVEWFLNQRPRAMSSPSGRGTPGIRDSAGSPARPGDGADRGTPLGWRPR